MRRVRWAFAALLLAAVIATQAVGGDDPAGGGAPSEGGGPAQGSAPAVGERGQGAYRGDPDDPFPPRTIGPEAMRAGCVSCHAPTEPGMAAAFQASRHAEKGVTCADCHGTDHTTIFGDMGRVSAATCGKCHERQVAEFKTSAHATAEADLLADARFRAAPPAVKAACAACHSIGARDPKDGSIGRCNSCHVGHEFRAAQAREPEACAGCHRGPDHPQAEAYFASKHGIAWSATKDPARAPTCASCHMPEGAHGRDATISIGGSRHGARVSGDARHPAPPYDMPVITTAAATTAREAALALCARCHVRRAAADALEGADEVKRLADRTLDGMARAIGRTRTLAGRAPPVLGPDQVPERGDALERRFHEAFAHRAPTAWKGAYHLSQGHVFGEGLGPLGVIAREVEEAASGPAAPTQGALPAGGR